MDDTTPQALVDAIKTVLSDADGSIPLHEPEFTGNEWAYVRQCIDDGWVSSVGAFVDRFEADLARRSGVRHAVATVNGTAALHAALLVLGVGADDEVLVPTLTFVATANAVTYTGAVPHFIESNPDRLGVCPKRLESYLEDISELAGDEGGRPLYRNRLTGRYLRAVVPVHVFGHPVDMSRLNVVAERFGMSVIEDATEALGSTYKGRAAGSFGKMGVLSFNGNKIITSGGGGAILTDDDAIAKEVRHLTTTAKKPHAWAYDHDKVGFNYRLPNINAALGCAQLEQLDGMIANKRLLADRYASALVDVPGVTVLREPADSHSNYWLNAILLDEGATQNDRDRVLQALHGAGFLCRPVWTLMHRLPMYSGCPAMPLAVAESLERRLINLPSSAKWGTP